MTKILRNFMGYGTTKSKLTCGVYLFLALVIALLYLPSVWSVGFISDDWVFKHKSILHDITKPLEGHHYSLLINLLFKGSAYEWIYPSTFHWLAIGFHFVNSCLVYSIFHRGLNYSIQTAFWIALIFAICATSVEALVWCCSVGYIIFSTWILAGLYVFLRFSQDPSKDLKKTSLLLALFQLLALLSWDWGGLFLPVLFVFLCFHPDRSSFSQRYKVLIPTFIVAASISIFKWMMGWQLGYGFNSPLKMIPDILISPFLVLSPLLVLIKHISNSPDMAPFYHLNIVQNIANSPILEIFRKSYPDISFQYLSFMSLGLFVVSCGGWISALWLSFRVRFVTALILIGMISMYLFSTPSWNYLYDLIFVSLGLCFAGWKVLSHLLHMPRHIMMLLFAFLICILPIALVSHHQSRYYYFASIFLWGAIVLWIQYLNSKNRFKLLLPGVCLLIAMHDYDWAHTKVHHWQEAYSQSQKVKEEIEQIGLKENKPLIIVNLPDSYPGEVWKPYMWRNGSENFSVSFLSYRTKDMINPNLDFPVLSREEILDQYPTYAIYEVVSYQKGAQWEYKLVSLNEVMQKER